MFVVPIEKDKILTKDRQHLRVVSYTNFKEGGPAVYCRSKDSKDLILIYFFDIDEINGVRVEYSKATRVFNALGKITRSQHLPQDGDTITVPNEEGRRGSSKTAKVSTLKLKSKSHGHNKGLMVKDTDGNVHRLKDVKDIDRALGTDTFDLDKFQDIYSDYLGV